MENIIKNYLFGVISREEAIEVLQRKFGLTQAQAEEAVGE